MRKGGWRDTAGEEGCKNYEMYEEPESKHEMFEANSFCKFLIVMIPSPYPNFCRPLADAGATKDFMIGDSCYGSHIPAMILDMKRVVGEFRASGKQIDSSIRKVMGHPTEDDPSVFRKLVQASLQ